MNNPALREMAGGCSCPLKGKHLRLESCFTTDTVKSFAELCRPDCATVFERIPRACEPLCKFPGAYPLPAMRRLLELQLPAIAALKSPDNSLQRPAHKPPRWIGDLGRSLQWTTIMQYKFKKQNHININEELASRSLLKRAAKCQLGSRIGVLLDSGVTIGCNAKGRPSRPI